MNKITVILAMVSALSGVTAFAANSKNTPRVRVSVTEFDQKVDHWIDGCKRWWGWRTQDQLKSVLEAELAKHHLRVVERTALRQMHHDEFIQENLDPTLKAKTNKFVAAQYAISGGLTELGICEDEEDTGLELGGIVSLLGGPSTDLNIAKGGAKSKAKVTAKVVAVETGEIVQSFTAEAEITDQSHGVELSVVGIGGKKSKSSQPPIERASNMAVAKLAEQIADYLNQ